MQRVSSMRGVMYNTSGRVILVLILAKTVSCEQDNRLETCLYEV